MVSLMPIESNRENLSLKLSLLQFLHRLSQSQVGWDLESPEIARHPNLTLT
jgi:hypothetical protein